MQSLFEGASKLQQTAVNAIDQRPVSKVDQGPNSQKNQEPISKTKPAATARPANPVGSIAPSYGLFYAYAHETNSSDNHFVLIFNNVEKAGDWFDALRQIDDEKLNQGWSRPQPQLFAYEDNGSNSPQQIQQHSDMKAFQRHVIVQQYKNASLPVIPVQHPDGYLVGHKYLYVVQASVPASGDETDLAQEELDREEGSGPETLHYIVAQPGVA